MGASSPRTSEPFEAGTHTNGQLALAVPPALVEAIAARVAELLVERLPHRPDPYLTVEQAAEYLACGKKRVYELKATGRLAHFRDGSRLLFRREDLDAALVRREPE